MSPSPAKQNHPRYPMKPSQIFDLIVRLSGYFVLFYSLYITLNMVIGPMDFHFKSFLLVAINGALGVAIMKVSPVITALAYGEEA